MAMITIGFPPYVEARSQLPIPEDAGDLQKHAESIPFSWLGVNFEQ
jgi:hypothetical protein